MLILDKSELVNYYTSLRIWQGIPSIAVTLGGKLFVTFYSGGLKEEIGNYVVLLQSKDGFVFYEPIAVCYKEGGRCFDPCLWVDPLNRLWLFWAYLPGENEGVYASICDNPDDDEMRWCEPFLVGHNVMMNKPTILSTGEWLFPIAVWSDYFRAFFPKSRSVNYETGAFVYKSVDNGKSFIKMGGANILDRSFDEHMVIEKENGNLMMFIRTTYGIGVSYSFDRGQTWSKGEDSGIKGPSSRFHIQRLPSGRILLINHYNFNGRNNLYAMLSEDECKNWKYKLLLDERNDISYPDAAYDQEGFIHITYDRERGGFKSSLEEAYQCAREILYAKITEEDIMAGKIINPNSRLKVIVSKLGKYADEAKNPFKEIDKLTDNELADFLSNKTVDEALNNLFSYFALNCTNMGGVEGAQLDSLIKNLKEDKNKRHRILKIIKLIRNIKEESFVDMPIIDAVKKLILENLSYDISLDEIVECLGISKYYLIHTFKQITGTTIIGYKNALRLTKAKDLLINTNKHITEIAVECGFGNASYFAKLFKNSENISPGDYRKYHKY